MADFLSQLVGRDVVSLKGISYVGEGANRESTLEALELIFPEGESALFTSSTDWTLQITRGSYPVPPNWCWPSNAWIFVDLETPLASPGWSRIINASDLLSEVQEIIGVVLQFRAGRFTIKSADVIGFEFVPDRPES